MDNGWTYDGYWLAVLGCHNARGIVETFNLAEDRRSLSEWLGEAEDAAAEAGERDEPGWTREDLLSSWSRFHEMALSELHGAASTR